MLFLKRVNVTLFFYAMKKLLIAGLILLAACGEKEERPLRYAPDVERRSIWNAKIANDSLVFAKIESLSEVKCLLENQRYDSLGKKTLLITDTPGKADNYYEIQIGLTANDSFHPYMNFQLDLEHDAMLFNDTANDARLSIEAWRNNNTENNIDYCK